jgi:hypothetical protein
LLIDCVVFLGFIAHHKKLNILKRATRGRGPPRWWEEEAHVGEAVHQFRNFVSRRDVKIVRVKSEDSLYMVTQGLPLVLSIGCRMVFNHISSICLIIVQSQIM